MKITLIVGLPGCGKSTYAKNHLTESSLVYDLDAIASAFRLCQPHDEYHKGSRQLANIFLDDFVNYAPDYTDNLLIIRTAPPVEDLDFISPSELVWCRERYAFRPIPHEERVLERINTAVRWCNDNSIPVIYYPY